MNLFFIPLAFAVPESGTMELDRTQEIYLESRVLRVNIHHQKGANLEHFDSSILLDKFVEYSLLYKDVYGIKPKVCTAPEINIYYVVSSYLNSPAYLYSWLGDSADFGDGVKYVGLYHYAVFHHDIFISDSHYDIMSLEKRFVHEMSHYWDKESCIYRDLSGEEKEARAEKMEGLVK